VLIIIKEKEACQNCDNVEYTLDLLAAYATQLYVILDRKLEKDVSHTY